MKSGKLANKFWSWVVPVVLIAVFCLSPLATNTLTPSAAATVYAAPSYQYSSNWYEELGVVDYNNYLYALQNTSPLKTVTVAVIDSGLDYTSNPVFKDRVNIEDARNFNLTGGRTTQDWNIDESGHGTHVAGIIAAGSMANVQILPIRIFVGTDNSMNFSHFVDAINYVANNAKALNIVACNLSLGTIGIAADQDKRVFEAAFNKDLGNYQPYINRLRRAGVLPVVAAGNIDTQAGETEAKSYYSFPASCEGAVSVSAYYRDNHGIAKRAYFSYYNERVTLSAPGLEIWSACSSNIIPDDPTQLIEEGDDLYYFQKADGNYAHVRAIDTDGDGVADYYNLRLRGTSMATPFVTLCYALICGDPTKTTADALGVEWDADVDTQAPYYYLNPQHKALLLKATDFYLEDAVGKTDVYFGYGGVNVKAFAQDDVTPSIAKDPSSPSLPAYVPSDVGTTQEIQNWASVFWILIGMTLVMALIGFLRGCAVRKRGVISEVDENGEDEDDDE